MTLAQTVTSKYDSTPGTQWNEWVTQNPVQVAAVVVIVVTILVALVLVTRILSADE